jgi:TPR repeat protein
MMHIAPFMRHQLHCLARFLREGTSLKAALVFATSALLVTGTFAADVESARRKMTQLTSDQMSQAWDLFEAGAAAARAGNRRAALSAFLAGLEIDPGEMRIRFLVAEQLEAEGKDGDAVEQWQLAEGLARTSADKARALAALTRLGGSPLPPPKPRPLTPEEARRLYERASSDANAMTTLRKAAEEGQAVAQLQFGRLYENGWGVPKDNDQAMQWFRKGADAGNAEARERLVALQVLRDAEARREREAQQAALRAREAERAQKETEHLIALYGQAKAGDAARFAEIKAIAAGGHADAQNFAGACYFNGYGTDKDAIEATRWWVRSARQGNSNAAKNLEMLRKAGYMVDIVEREEAKHPFERTAPKEEALGDSPTLQLMGLQVSELSDAQKTNMKLKGGIKVVASSAAAARAGIDEGDVIVQIANAEVRSVRELEAAVAQLDKNKPIAVLLRRGELAGYAVIRLSRD